MSVMKRLFIYCDHEGCKRSVRVDCSLTTTARMVAQAGGWFHSGSYQDYCPAHWDSAA